MDSQWILYGFSMDSNDSTQLSLDSLWILYGFSKDSKGFSGDALWILYGFFDSLRILFRFCCDSLMILRFSYGLSLDFLRIL